MKLLSTWKFWIVVTFMSMIATKCHPVYALEYNVVAQTTQIITPDGKLITCITNGQLITCF